MARYNKKNRDKTVEKTKPKIIKRRKPKKLLDKISFILLIMLCVDNFKLLEINYLDLLDKLYKNIISLFN